MAGRHFIFLSGLFVALATAQPASSQSFDPPPFPVDPSPQTSAVRGIRDVNDPMNSPAAPAGASAAPPATFVAPGAMPTADVAPITPTPISPEAQQIAGSEIVARVEDQVILASDVMWQVQRLIAMGEKQSGKTIPPEQRPLVEKIYLEKMVMQLVDTKLLFADFRRTLPPENLAHVQKTLAEPFEKNEMPRLLSTYEVKDRVELELALIRNGSSLKDVQRQYIEKTVAGEWLRQRIPKLKEPTHEDMLAYYQDHLKEYEFPATVKWEELMIRFDRSGGDIVTARKAAWESLAAMGNEVWQQVEANPGIRGPVFAAVAKTKSHGFTASDGGLQDTTIGSLKCEDLNAALATLEIGRMSDCIESEQGFHLIRVLERKEAGRTPFTEAQPKIREMLEAEQKEVLVAEELKKLRKTARVWTIFHGDLTGERLAEVLDEKKRR